MDSFTLCVWMCVLFCAATVSAYPSSHLYLGYISPTEFIRGFNEDASRYIFHPFRSRRSAMSYGYQPMHQHYGNMGYNPMHSPIYNPFGMSSFYNHFPAMPSFNPPAFHNPFHHSMPASNDHASHPATSHPFSDHFMKMMGFPMPKLNFQPPKMHFPQFNFPKMDFPKMNAHPSKEGDYSYNYNSMSASNSASGQGKGNNYEMSYSNSYEMNMDPSTGKGHMMTKGNSYVNDNGKITMHNSPETHYESYGNGKFVPVHH